MKVFPFLLFLLISCSVSLNAQTAKAFEKAGDRAFENKNYSAALEHYRQAMEIKEKKVSLWYKYAEVARMYNAFEIAETYYRRILSNSKSKEFPLTPFRLGMVYKSMGEYKKAQKYFKRYLKKQKATGEFGEQAQREITYCTWAQEITQNETGVKVQALNKRVNTKYSEFGPFFRGDTLYYSSFRFVNRDDKADPPRRVSKVLTSVKGSKGKPMRRKFNADGKLTAHTTFSQDDQRIYFTVCEYRGDVEIFCELHYRAKDKRGRWGKAVKLSEEVNSITHTTTHPSIGYDSLLQQEILYFASDRPGGKGGLDIWFCPLDKKGKPAAAAKNLETVNTPGDDLTPFFYNGEQALYFSSDYHQGLGGYDIFKIKKNGKDWTEIEHLGYPLNTSYNEVYFTRNVDSTLAYFSSNRPGSLYLDPINKACCNDIYQANFPTDTIVIEEPQVDSLLIVEIPKDSVELTPKPPVVEAPPTSLEDFLPLALYFDNDEPDKRTRRTTTKKSYGDSYYTYYNRKVDFRKEYSQNLEGEAMFRAEDEIEQFFEFKVKRGFDYLELFSNILLQKLEEGEKVEIFVKGYTSPRAKSDYNLRLGKRRISSVRNHFQTYFSNIFAPYIKSGQLTITERSFGETTVATGVNDDLENQRLSIYSPAASQERRVEIVEIKRQ